MLSTQESKSRSLGLSKWLGYLHCVLGQDTLLSHYLSPPQCTNEYGVNLILDANPATNVH